METPETIELRKKKIESEMEGYIYIFLMAVKIFIAYILFILQK